MIELINLGNNKIELIKIKSGTFVMGANSGLPIEQPAFECIIKKDFYIASTPVTQKLYTSIQNENPSYFSGDQKPVDSVSWVDAKNFCIKLSEKINKKVRLPTEEEWEYCCRAGTEDEFFFGSSDRSLRDYAWYNINSKGETQEVSKKEANPWGLFDIVGNVWEWCENCWNSSYPLSTSHSYKNTYENTNKIYRSIRGGGYNLDSYRCRSSYRSSERQDMRLRSLGFRVLIEDGS